jgi:hypothetical protein
MPDREHSDFGFINSLLVILVSIGLTVVLLWIVSRITGQPWFEQLPHWLRSGMAEILTALFSGGSLATIVYKKLSSQNSPNFLYPILTTTLFLLVVILLLVFFLRPRESHIDPPAPRPNPPVADTLPPTPKKELHRIDQNDQEYVERWSARGNCREAKQDETHQCIFTTTQRQIGASNTRFDHWKLMLKTPGPPYEVLCEPGGWQLKENDAPGPGQGSIEGNWAICSGWINGSEDHIQMTVKYQLLR